MDPIVKPGATLRSGVRALTARSVQFLLENKVEVEKLFDGIDERRDAALKAIEPGKPSTTLSTPGRRPRKRRFAAPYNAGISGCHTPIKRRNLRVIRYRLSHG